VIARDHWRARPGSEAPPVRNEPAPGLPDGHRQPRWPVVGGGRSGTSRRDPERRELPLLPAAVEADGNRAQRETDDPHLWCMPMGVPRSTPYPFRWVQDITGARLVRTCSFIHEGNIHSYRQIFMDRPQASGGARPDMVRPLHRRWRTRTRWSSTPSLNDKFLVRPQGDAAQRAAPHPSSGGPRPTMGTLVNTVTIEDPSTTRAFTVSFTARLQAPGDEIMEYICQRTISTARPAARQPVLRQMSRTFFAAARSLSCASSRYPPRRHRTARS